MAKSKKKNPSRLPTSKADVQKAKVKAPHGSTSSAKCHFKKISTYGISQKGGFFNERL